VKSFNKILLLCSSAFLMFSCDNEDDDVPSSTLPSTYNFTNVDYSTQTTELHKLEEITTYGKTPVTDGATLDKQNLMDMFDVFKSKTNEDEVSLFNDWIDELVLASQSNYETAAFGQAGVVESGTKRYLLNEKGIEPIQIIEKGLMGAFMYHQIQNVCLESDRMNADNSTIVDGKDYTQLENNWDQAFGYFGSSADWPTNNDGERFWAKYAQKTNSAVTGSIDTPTEITNAFVKGRAAIADGDKSTKDEQITIIKTTLETITAGTAINYINSALKDIQDDAVRTHALSEAWAFIYAIKFTDVDVARSTPADVESWLELLGTNFWDVSVDNLNQIKNEISTKYGFDSFKDNL
jgi:hypothetical protein